MNDTFRLDQGAVPLLISLPHAGTRIPAELHDRLVPRALDCEDTDWHLEALYGAIARALGASLLVADCSRYVIDLNRPPHDEPLYPGQHNTGLCPTRFFTGDPLYRAGAEPDSEECAARRVAFWQPYHDALAAELGRLRNAYGVAVLFDAHSIRSQLPWLFEGRLPDLNLGTADGRACSPALANGLRGVLAAQAERSWVVDGRFKGGYITRHYGQPAAGWQAVQLEMCQSCYMQEVPPFAWSESLAATIQPLLRRLLERTVDWTGTP